MGMDRLSSGIIGLDEHIEGGMPVPSLVLIKGTPGAGKTTFGVQSLFSGAKQGQTGIYVTGVSEPVPIVKRYLSVFSFYEEAYIKDGRIQFWDLGETVTRAGAEGTLEAMRQILKSHRPRRVVLDPLPPRYFFEGEREYRRFLSAFFDELRVNNTLTIGIGEQGSAETIGIEEYMADGVIGLDIVNLEGNPLVFKNVMRVCKMRGTNHTRNLLSVDITAKGIKVDRLA
jgi:circadian clock protein KaiC